MAKINISQLVNNAAHGADLADRAYQVAQDPAVQKAWSLAAADSVRLGQSVGRAVAETIACWYRTTPRNAMYFAS
jgi:hypothetical protein